MTAKSNRKSVSDGIAFTGKSWSYVLRVPISKDSKKTKPKWVGGFDTRKQAKLARDEARVALARKKYREPSKKLLGDYLDEWIKVHDVAPTTLVSYRELINNYLKPRLGSIPLESLSALDVETFYFELMTTKGKKGENLSPATASRCVSVLKACLRRAVRIRDLTHNPAREVSIREPESKKTELWTRDQLDKVFLPCALQPLKLTDKKRAENKAKGVGIFEPLLKYRLGFFFRLCAYTGARRGELLALRWSDLQGSDLHITKSRTLSGKAVIEKAPKTKGSNRVLSLDDKTMLLFNAHRRRQVDEARIGREKGEWFESDYVFVRENGKPLDTGTVTKLFVKISKEAGLKPMRLHDLRHLYATELLRTYQPHTVGALLGHANPKVTLTVYGHVDKESQDKASDTFARDERAV
jgi:integrase